MSWNIRYSAKLSRSLLILVLVFYSLSRCSPLYGQTISSQIPSTTETRQITALGETSGLICPGGFSTDLTVTNCKYTRQIRLQQWFATSFSDQAMLGAIVYGAGAQIIKSPQEWGRTWGGYGDRIGVRYTQGAARGTAEFLVGSLMRDDPRHLSYKDDPHTPYGSKISTCQEDKPIQIKTYPMPSHLVWKRISHAFVDSVTVRKSNSCGTGTGLPAIDRMVGVVAGAYGGYPWYPQAENSLANVGQRAATSYGSTLAGSFYTEFSPEISLLLKRIFVHQRKY
jgi:hypothetical protein